MSRQRFILVSTAAALFCLVPPTTTRAEEIEKKFRLGFSIGGYSITDQVHSGSANTRVLLTDNGQVSGVLQDPRNDSGAFSDFGLEPQNGAVFTATYGFSRLWYVEGSVGYRRGNVGNIEMQAHFEGVVPTPEDPQHFTVFNLKGGTETQVPVEITAGIRFRPKASFNPYLCLGVGYSFNSFSPSTELNTLSTRLDQSIGAFARVNSSGALDPADPSSFKNLSGITVDNPNTPEWHFGGGLEYTVARHWSIFLDARYTVYSGKFHMMVNGSDSLGISVPNDQILASDPNALGGVQGFGGYQITQGGLVDGGSWAPSPGFPNQVCGQDAHASHTNCQFLPGVPEPLDANGHPQSHLDIGYYYVQGGRIRFDNASYQIGFKYTF